MNVSSQAESTNSPFLHIFVLFRPSSDWTMPSHIGEIDLLYSVYALETPLQTNPEIIFTSYLGISRSSVKLTHKINPHKFMDHTL